MCANRIQSTLKVLTPRDCVCIRQQFLPDVSWERVGEAVDPLWGLVGLSSSESIALQAHPVMVILTGAGKLLMTIATCKFLKADALRHDA